MLSIHDYRIGLGDVVYRLTDNNNLVPLRVLPTWNTGRVTICNFDLRTTTNLDSMYSEFGCKDLGSLTINGRAVEVYSFEGLEGCSVPKGHKVIRVL